MNASLAMTDAVPLAHVLAVDVARRAGIRALVIKGPSAAAHGLRAQRVSADADVLVSPDDLDNYLRALAQCGWSERPGGDLRGPHSEHSVTLLHSGWPCDIDVHRHFPGFLAEGEGVFNELWARRQPLGLAGVEVDMVDTTGAILISALHALRTPAQTPRHAAEIRGLVDLVLPRLDGDARDDLVVLAVATGAADTARPLLERLGSELPAPTPFGVDSALDAWRERIGARGEVLAKYSAALRRVPRSNRVGWALGVIWPNEADFRSAYPDTAPGHWAAFRARLRRLRLGVAALGAARRVLRGRSLARGGVTDSSILDEDPR